MGGHQWARASSTGILAPRGSFPNPFAVYTKSSRLAHNSQPGPPSSVRDSLPGPVLAVEVTFPIGCHPGCASGKGRGACGPSAAGGLPRRPTVNGTDRELPRTPPVVFPAVSLRCPCGLPLRRKVPCSRGWLLPTAGPGTRSPLLVTAWLAWEGRIGGWMRETRACSWAQSRFGEQDKQWSLHTAITISSSSAAMLQCCTV